MPEAKIDGELPTGIARGRLDSWKEIATYLKRSTRTVRRWERHEGLPVHLPHHGTHATIYALPHEIDAWLASRRSAEPSRTPSAAHAAQPLEGIARGLEHTTHSKRPIVVAVLPLRNLGGDPGEQRFADGLTEEIIFDIGNCCPPRLRVIALTSVMQYKQSPKSILEIGRELGADYVLEGGIRRYGRRIRLTARLIAARDQTHIWADSYEIQLPPIFSLQQSLARRVAGCLAAELNLTPRPDWHREAPQSAAAYDAYIRGTSFFHPTEEDLKKKVEYFSLAVLQGRRFARSYAELALVYLPRLYRDYPPIATCKRIHEYASQALNSDPKLARAHSMSAAFHLFGAWNYHRAEASSRRAINLNASDPWARVIRAACHLAVGKNPDAIQELEEARKSAPQSSDLGFWFMLLGHFSRHYDWTIERCMEMLQRSTSIGAAHALLGACYAQKGEYSVSLKHCDKARELASESIMGMARVCSTYALAGRRDVAESLLQELIGMQEKRYMRWLFLAQASVAVRNDRQTLEWLEKAYEQRDAFLVFLKVDQRFEPLSDNARFRNLLRRIGRNRRSPFSVRVTK